MSGIIVLIAYAALMIGATVVFTKPAHDAESFHVADRHIGTGVAAMSIAATWIWAPSLFVSAEKAYTSGIPGLFWFLVPNVLCLVLFIPFAKHMRSAYPEGVTLTGYMATVYDSQKVKGVYSFQLGALAVLSTAVQLLAGSKMLSAITGAPFWIMTIILAVIAYSYSCFSGIKASVTTDVIQLAIILLGCALLVPWSLSRAGGSDAVIAGLGSITGDHMSLFSETGLSVFLGFGLPTVIGLTSGPFGDQCFWQRTFAIRKDRIGRSFFIGALIFAVVPLSMGAIGFAAAGTGFIPTDVGMVNAEFIMSLLPSWILAPLLMMVLSGLLSTVDSNLCAAASLTTDLRIFATMDFKGRLKLSQLAMVGLLLVAILAANIPGLTVTHLFLFYGTLRASTLLPTALTLIGKRLNANGVFAGIVASLCLGLPVFAVGNIWNIAAYKTVGSLITVLLSGAVALAFSRKGVRV